MQFSYNGFFNEKLDGPFLPSAREILEVEGVGDTNENEDDLEEQAEIKEKSVEKYPVEVLIGTENE